MIINRHRQIQMHNAQLAGCCKSIGRQYHHNDGWGRKRIPYNTNNDLMFNDKKNYKMQLIKQPEEKDVANRI